MLPYNTTYAWKRLKHIFVNTTMFQGRFIQPKYNRVLTKYTSAMHGKCARLRSPAHWPHEKSSYFCETTQRYISQGTHRVTKNTGSAAEQITATRVSTYTDFRSYVLHTSITLFFCTPESKLNCTPVSWARIACEHGRHVCTDDTTVRTESRHGRYIDTGGTWARTTRGHGLHVGTGYTWARAWSVFPVQNALLSLLVAVSTWAALHLCRLLK